MLEVPNNEDTEVNPSILLHLARRGDSIELEEFLINNKQIDINYTGKLHAFKTKIFPCFCCLFIKHINNYLITFKMFH